MNNIVRMRVHFPESYDAGAIDELLDNEFPEADLMYLDRTVTFFGPAERSQELLRALETIGEHDGVRLTRF